MFFRSVWCSLGLKIWPGEPKSVGSNLRAFMKHPQCIASIKPFNISKWKMLTTSTNHDHSKRSSLIRPNSLHLHKALLKVWLQRAHWALVPKLKVLSVYFSPCMCCTASFDTYSCQMNHTKMNHATGSPKLNCYGLRVGGSHHAHVCAARVLNQNPWHHECGFYIIILNKPVARHYKKNTHTVSSFG